MNKKILIILSLILLLLGGIYLVMNLPINEPKDQNNRHIDREKPVDKPEPPKEVKPPVKVDPPEAMQPPIKEKVLDKAPRPLSTPIKGINQILFNGGDSNNWTIESIDDEWVVKGLERVDQTALNSLVAEILNLRSLETISFLIKGDEEKWGFSTTSPTLTIRGEKETRTFLLGKNSRTKSGVYLQIEGGDEVFLVGNLAAKNLTRASEEIRNRNLPLVTGRKINSLNLTIDEDIQIVPYKKRDNFTADAYRFMLKSPYEVTVPLETSVLYDLITPLSSPLLIKDFIDRGRDEDYGIKEGRGLFIDDDEAGINLLVGNTVGKIVYCRIEEEDQIFTLDKKDLPLLDATPFDLADKIAHLIALDKIDAFSIEGEEVFLTGEIARKSGGTLYSLNGLELDEKEFKELYMKTLFLLYEGEVKKNIEGKETFRISYKLYGGGSLWTVLKFFPYDDKFFAVTKDYDPPLFLVGRYQIKELITLLEGKLDKLMGF